MGQTCAAGFYPAFKVNMEAIGLTAPSNLFATQTSTLGVIGQLAGVVQTMGMKVTLRELVGAGTVVEKLSYLGALYGAYYLGGMIGSLWVAGDSFYTCKNGPAAAAQMHQAIFASGIAPFSPSMQLFLMNHPELFDLSSQQRKTYGMRARSGAGL
ncbi:hypothetical protein DWV00_28110 [Trinickia dinghuensis]|uniref:Uncharacterized protein n=2 Tax=Trinickia dinghuensis TaxID=2291023 RepID=A0A3D8JRB4_9BURK|nr:hypothetical protein DWV00_28110 [Trinickia dinghuensis]